MESPPAADRRSGSNTDAESSKMSKTIGIGPEFSKMTQLTQLAISNLMNPKHRISDKMFKYQRVISRRQQKKTSGADHVISFAADAVFQVVRQVMWAASHIVNKEKFKLPIENLQSQLYLLSKYEHKIRLAVHDDAKLQSDFIEDIRQLRNESEQFLEQLEQKWYINLWLHEQEIMEEFEAIHKAIDEIKGTIIDSLLDCIESEVTARTWNTSMASLESREQTDAAARADKIDGQLVQWDSM